MWITHNRGKVVFEDSCAIRLVKLTQYSETG